MERNMTRKILLTALTLLLIVSLGACGKAITDSDVSGYWQSNVTAVEYLELGAGEYQIYNDSGRATFSGSFGIDGKYIVLDGTKKNDEDAWMILEYVDSDTLRYEWTAAGTTENFVRTESFGGFGADKSNEPDWEVSEYGHWYGTYDSDNGSVEITPNQQPGNINFVITPNVSENDDGSVHASALTSYVELIDENTAQDDYLRFSLDGDTLTIQAFTDFGKECEGDYERR